MSNKKAMTKARILLIICDVLLWAAYLILLLGTGRGGLIRSYGFLVLMIITIIIAPWREMTMLRSEGGFLAEENELDENKIHELIEQPEESSNG